MILLLYGCDTPATLYPVDPCRLGESFASVSAEVTCTGPSGTVSASATWSDDTRAGGTRGEGWDGLSFYATGTTTSGGTLSVGRRPDGVGLYLLDGGTDVKVGFLPASTEAPEAPFVTVTDGALTCDAMTGAGAVHISGLPESWAPGGTWDMTFDNGTFEADPVPTTWSAPWPATCPIHPSAWASTRVTASCAGEERAFLQLQAPASYGVELDTIGQVGTVAVTWSEAYAARCEGADAAISDGSLQSEDGVSRIYTPILVVTGNDDAWSVESTTCGTCDAWDVTVEGLPAL